MNKSESNALQYFGKPKYNLLATYDFVEVGKMTKHNDLCDDELI